MYMKKTSGELYMYMKNLVGPDKLYKRSLNSAVSSLLALISREYTTAYLSAPPVYIRKAHQNISGSAVSELMRFIHHIITYVVPATPRAINWARPLFKTTSHRLGRGNEATKDTHTHWGTST